MGYVLSGHSSCLMCKFSCKPSGKFNHSHSDVYCGHIIGGGVDIGVGWVYEKFFEAKFFHESPSHFISRKNNKLVHVC